MTNYAQRFSNLYGQAAGGNDVGWVNPNTQWASPWYQGVDYPAGYDPNIPPAPQQSDGSYFSPGYGGGGSSYSGPYNPIGIADNTVPYTGPYDFQGYTGPSGYSGPMGWQGAGNTDPSGLGGMGSAIAGWLPTSMLGQGGDQANLLWGNNNWGNSSGDTG